jgi:hypothetical protein
VELNIVKMEKPAEMNFILAHGRKRHDAHQRSGYPPRNFARLSQSEGVFPLLVSASPACYDSYMKFKEAVRHLEDLGSVVLIPNGKSPQSKKRLRHRKPVRVVPVRILGRDALPVELRDMIRQSRAEINQNSKK